MKENNSLSDGYTKFDCEWIQVDFYEDISSLNIWRNRLYAMNLIGAYPNGIGYGNISIRTPDNNFIISGSKTGNIPFLTKDNYSKVVGFDIDKNYLRCVGKTQASSESMTHATIYSIDKSINAVIHVHNLDLWNKLLNNVPTASKDAQYGTPEIAREMIKLFYNENAGKKGIIVTEGHEEGVFTFGKDLDTAGSILIDYFNKK